MEAKIPKNWKEIPELREVKDLKEADALEKVAGQKEGFTMLKGGKGYTTADIEALPEGERAELIDGELFRMDAPTRIHQKILIELAYEIKRFIKNKKGSCDVYAAPFAVYIKKDKRSYVEPDISVICDRDKLDEKGCQGAPDWLIEIVSPSSKKMDYEIKVELYREAGAREYWIVDPETETVTVYDFEHTQADGAPDNNGNAAAGKTIHEAEPARYTFSERIYAGIFKELCLDFSEMDLG